MAQAITSSSSSRASQSTIKELSLLLFWVYHPLNVRWFYPPGYPTFFQPMFLLLAGLLGIACTVIYALTGSLWGMALFHWLVVMVWLFGLGGKRRLVVKG